MYKLFIGFRELGELGEFKTILEAKQFAHNCGLSGAFSLIGDSYHDSWYVPNIKSTTNNE